MAMKHSHVSKHTICLSIHLCVQRYKVLCGSTYQHEIACMKLCNGSGMNFMA